MENLDKVVDVTEEVAAVGAKAPLNRKVIGIGVGALAATLVVGFVTFFGIKAIKAKKAAKAAITCETKETETVEESEN